MKENIYNNKYSGFFLIELLIAIGIFGMTCLLIAHFHASIMLSDKDSIYFESALNLATSVIEEARAFGISAKSFKINDFQLEIIPLTISAQNQTGKKQFEWFKVTVSWTFNNRDRLIAIDFGLIT